MVEREIFDRTKERHGGHGSWAVWAEATGPPKSNIGDMRVLDPDRNPTLLGKLRKDVVMVGLNISRPVLEPLRNFHDARPMGQDYKIRFAFKDTPCYGAYMTDFIKGIEMRDSNELIRYLRANPLVEQQQAERFLGELDDLQCDRPTILAFGGRAHELLNKNKNVPRDKYSRLIRLRHYADYISPEQYRQEVLKLIGSIS
jgi:hypothetical protein